MKIFIILFILCTSISTLVLAQTLTDHHPGQTNSNVLTQNGQLVSVRLVLGEPIRLFVVGREEAKLNLSDLKITVRRVKPYPGKVLSVNRDNDYFVITEPFDFKTSTDLEVTTKIKNKSETLRFKVESRLP